MNNNQRVMPFLMFDGKADEAMAFYVSLIPDSRVLSVSRYGEGGPGPAGTIVKGAFSLGGLTVMCSDSFVHHPFAFTPSMSLAYSCSNAEEVDRLAGALSEGGGRFLMPPNNYGFSRRFAWVSDRFGVSWQLNAE